MEMKLIRVLFGCWLAVITVMVGMYLMTTPPKSKEATLLERRVGIYHETSMERRERQALCRPIQAEINAQLAAAGKRGAEHLSMELRTKIAAMKNSCIFIGDEEGY